MMRNVAWTLLDSYAHMCIIEACDQRKPAGSNAILPKDVFSRKVKLVNPTAVRLF